MNSAADAQPLAGRGIVVTRPAHQASSLAGLIEAAGGKAILFPTVEIVEIADQRPLLGLIDRLDEFDIAIFISPNAARQAMTVIQARRALPQRLQLAAIGHGGARELARFGLSQVTVPTQFDSEALLDLPGFRDVAGKRVVIFRGEGGREVLGDTLAARGALIEYAACYRRRRPDADPAPLLDAWERDELHAVIVTSSEGWRNLFDLVGTAGQSWLRKTPVFVPHPRIAHSAGAAGLAIIVPTAQGDAGLVQEMTRWFAGSAAYRSFRPGGSAG